MEINETRHTNLHEEKGWLSKIIEEIDSWMEHIWLDLV
jgi:hypothetical protein